MLQTTIKKIREKLDNLRIRLLAPWLTKPPELPKDPEPVVIKGAPNLPKQVVWQGLLLQDNEIIVYKDDSGELHYLSRFPIDKEKRYNVIHMDGNDLVG